MTVSLGLYPIAGWLTRVRPGCCARAGIDARLTEQELMSDSSHRYLILSSAIALCSVADHLCRILNIYWVRTIYYLCTSRNTVPSTSKMFSTYLLYCIKIKLAYMIHMSALEASRQGWLEIWGDFFDLSRFAIFNRNIERMLCRISETSGYFLRQQSQESYPSLQRF